MAGDRLMAVAFRILRDVDRAEDAVQQTIVAAWQDLPTLRDPDRFAGWLYRILVHACYAELRRERRRTETVRVLPGTPIAQDDILSVDDRDQLERAFRRLPPDQRAVFAFHHYLGMRLPEIAENLDIPLGTAKSRLHYATATLRAAIDADDRTSSDSVGERSA
jgi:RNA polymerase sigma-70 factor (ECF subfamily)